MDEHLKEITHEVFGTFHLVDDPDYLMLEDHGDALVRRLRGKQGQPAKNRATVQAAQDSGILIEEVLPDGEGYQEAVKAIHPSKMVWLAREIQTVIIGAYEYPDPVEEKN